MLASFTWGLEDQRFVKIGEVKRRTYFRSEALRRNLSLKSDLPAFSLVVEELFVKGIVPKYHEYLHIETSRLSWDDLPYDCTPAGGLLPEARITRKTQQIESMTVLIKALIEFCVAQKVARNDSTPVVVVEFCSGSGFVGLPLAAAFPHVQFVLIDFKDKSVSIARHRISGASLQNVTVVLGPIEDYCETFDVGIALHACGSASDVSMQKCYTARAPFVVCPCCIGKVNHNTQSPQSQAVRDALNDEGCADFAGTPKSFAHRTPWARVLQAADFGHSDISFYSTDKASARANVQRRLCKSVVEWDRCLLAAEHGYISRLVLMSPREASPKNDIIVAWPSSFPDAFTSCSPNRLSERLRPVSCSLDKHLLGLAEEN